MLRPRLNGLLPATPGLHSPSVFPCLIQCPCVTGTGEVRLWRLRALPLGCCILSITVSSPEVGGTDQTLIRVWTGRRRKRRLCRGSRDVGHSCSGDPHLFCSRGLAAPREWVQEAEGPEPMLGCQVAWCQGDVWRRMGRGKEVGRRERWLPQPRRRGWQSIVSVVLRHRGGGQEGGEGKKGRGGLGPSLSFIPVDTSGLAKWAPGIRAAPRRAGLWPLLRRGRQLAIQWS